MEKAVFHYTGLTLKKKITKCTKCEQGGAKELGYISTKVFYSIRKEAILAETHFHLLPFVTYYQYPTLQINPFPNDNLFYWSKSKAFANYKINVTEKRKFSLEWVENIVGKGDNAGYQHFLFFPLFFQNASFSGLLKVGIVW